MKRSVGAVLVLCVVFSASTASARDEKQDTDRAAVLFDEAGRAFQAGSYRRAATLFEEAYAAAPHPSTLANAAEARVRAGDNLKGAQHYARLTDVPEERDNARAALSKLAPLLGRLVVSGDDALVDGAPAAVATTTWVEPGEHLVDGHVQRRPARPQHVRVAAGQLLRVSLVPEEPAAPRAEAAAGLPPIVTFILAGATVVAGGVTTWSGIDVLSQKRSFDAKYSDETLDRGLAAQSRTNVLIGVTIGLAVLTGAAAIFTNFSARSSGPRAAGSLQRTSSW